MTMAVKLFVDTNVILRALNPSFPENTAARGEMRKWREQQAQLWISGQIIREFLVQVTHPKTLKVPLTSDQIYNQLATIQSTFHVVDDTEKVRAQLIELLGAYPTRGKQIHDMNIVASMLANGVATLMTFNVADFRRYEDRIGIIVPSADKPI